MWFFSVISIGWWLATTVSLHVVVGWPLGAAPPRNEPEWAELAERARPDRPSHPSGALLEVAADQRTGAQLLAWVKAGGGLRCRAPQAGEPPGCNVAGGSVALYTWVEAVLRTPSPPLLEAAAHLAHRLRRQGTGPVDFVIARSISRAVRTARSTHAGLSTEALPGPTAADDHRFLAVELQRIQYGLDPLAGGHSVQASRFVLDAFRRTKDLTDQALADEVAALVAEVEAGPHVPLRVAVVGLQDALRAQQAERAAWEAR